MKSSFFFINIILEERTNSRGGVDQGHGRYKIFNTVLNQTIKLLDLWEEAIEMKLTLVKKGKKIAEKTDKMNQKITDQVKKKQKK